MHLVPLTEWVKGRRSFVVNNCTTGKTDNYRNDLRSIGVAWEPGPDYPLHRLKIGNLTARADSASLHNVILDMAIVSFFSEDKPELIANTFTGELRFPDKQALKGQAIAESIIIDDNLCRPCLYLRSGQRVHVWAHQPKARDFHKRPPGTSRALRPHQSIKFVSLPCNPLGNFYQCRGHADQRLR